MSKAASTFPQVRRKSERSGGGKRRDDGASCRNRHRRQNRSYSRRSRDRRAAKSTGPLDEVLTEAQAARRWRLKLITGHGRAARRCSASQERQSSSSYNGPSPAVTPPRGTVLSVLTQYQASEDFRGLADMRRNYVALITRMKGFGDFHCPRSPTAARVVSSWHGVTRLPPVPDDGRPTMRGPSSPVCCLGASIAG
jgi:hypothetical protein